MISHWATFLPTIGRNEGNVLFNDALNTFYLRLYGVIHMVEDHSDSERGNPLSPHRPLFPISSILYVSSHRQDNTYHGLSYTSRGALAETRNCLMCPPHEGSIRRPSRGALAGTRNCLMGPTTKDRSTNDPSHHELLPRSYISLPPPPPHTHTRARTQ